MNSRDFTQTFSKENIRVHTVNFYATYGNKNTENARSMQKYTKCQK